MGRMMPIDCPRCGGVLDWGDFGPGPVCDCKPTDWREIARELAGLLRCSEIRRPDAHAPVAEWNRYDRLCDRRRAVLEQEAHANGVEAHVNPDISGYPQGGE